MAFLRQTDLRLQRQDGGSSEFNQFRRLKAWLSNQGNSPSGNFRVSGRELARQIGRLKLLEY